MLIKSYCTAPPLLPLLPLAAHYQQIAEAQLATTINQLQQQQAHYRSIPWKAFKWRLQFYFHWIYFHYFSFIECNRQQRCIFRHSLTIRRLRLWWRWLRCTLQYTAHGQIIFFHRIDWTIDVLNSNWRRKCQQMKGNLHWIQIHESKFLPNSQKKILITKSKSAIQITWMRSWSIPLDHHSCCCHCYCHRVRYSIWAFICLFFSLSGAFY